LTDLLSHDTVLNILVAGGLINKLRNPAGFGYREIVKDTGEVLRTLEVRLHRTMAKQGGEEDEKGRR
jgi:hypothetical protein